MQITSAVVSYKYINRTIYIENGTESVDLACGEDLENAVTIYWSILKNKEWKKILKLYPNTSIKPTLYEKENTTDRYGISESVNTSLVIKNTDLLENNVFRCTTLGDGLNNIYNTLLKIGGKYCFRNKTQILKW